MPVLAPVPITTETLTASACTDLALGNVVCIDIPMGTASGIQNYEEVKTTWATYADVEANYLNYSAMKYDERE